MIFQDLENLARIISNGVIWAAVLVSSSIILAKVIECLAVRRVFRRKKNSNRR